MSALSFRNVCLMLLCVLRRHTVCSTKAITCDAGPYVPGEPASVSCNLHEDMTECKLSVIIERFRPNAPTSYPGKELVACRWEETAHDHTCSVENGYRFNDTNGDHPTLEIPSSDNNSAGFYMCYVMPPNDTKTHVCKLTPIARPVKQTTLSTGTSISTTPTDGHGETSSTSPFLIAAVVFAGMIIVVLVVYIVYGRRIKRYVCRHRQHKKKDAENPLNQDNGECTVEKTTAHANKKIEVYLKDFRLDAREYERIMSLLERELKARQAQMPSTVVRSLQKKIEQGNCLVVVLCSNMLKIVLFNMQGQNINSNQTENYKITSEIRQGTHQQVLMFIINSINNFVDTHELSGQRMPLGFVRLTTWTKGFVGKNLDEILQEALRNNENYDLEIKAIINDVVDMLISTAHQDANSKIALVLGDGFNTCFVHAENKRTVLQCDPRHPCLDGNQLDTEMYTTTECGSFGDGGCLDLYQTDFDRDLDKNSMNSREQIMEKMVSMVYLGEIVRLVLVKLTQEKLLFKSVARESALYKAESFKTSFMPLVERDTGGKFQSTECVLMMLEVDSYTKEDCETVQYVCRLISERAAHLAATVLAALVKHVNVPDITIAIDESLYRSHPRFHQLLIEKTLELVGEGSKVNIKPFPNESGRGAAFLAAVAT